MSSKIKVSQKDVQYYKNLFEQDVVLNNSTNDVFTSLSNYLKSEKNITIVDVDNAQFESLKVLEDNETIESVYSFQGVETETDYFDEIQLSLVGHFKDDTNAMYIDNIVLNIEEPII